MVKLAHIVNPVAVSDVSDLFVAQPITFESMRTARELAAGTVDVELFVTHYPEDTEAAPGDFTATPSLSASVLDHGTFGQRRKLPLMKDILDRLYQSTKAEFLVYSNVDISLQPHFYLAVDRIIAQGYDAFVVNRRTIPSIYTSVGELPLMYAEIGKPHRGWDCFIFPREAYPRYRLGTVCVGAPLVGLTLIANLVAHAENFREFKDRHMTFHLGDDKRWRGGPYADYADHNAAEALRVLRQLERETGPFDRRTPPGAYLLKRRLLGPLYEWWSRHASIPLALRRRLEQL